jgi:hypothetical protein
MRLNPSDTPILSKCVGFAKQYSILNKQHMRNLISVWKQLPQDEQEEYSTLDTLSHNVSYFCDGSRIHTPSPTKSPPRRQGDHTVSLQHLQKQSEQLNQLSLELSRELSTKSSFTRSPSARYRSERSLRGKRSNTPEIRSHKSKENKERNNEGSMRSQTPNLKRTNTSLSVNKSFGANELANQRKMGLYYKSPGRLTVIKSSGVYSQNMSQAASKVAHELAAREIELLDSKIRASRSKAIALKESLSSKSSKNPLYEAPSCIQIHGLFNCRLDKIDLRLIDRSESYKNNIFISCLKGANDLSLLRKNDIGVIFYIGDDDGLTRYPGIQGGYSCVPLLGTPDQNLIRWVPYLDKFLVSNLSKYNILIACYDGVNRSCAVCIGYFMRKYRISMVDAYNTIQASRPFIKLTDDFTQQLQAFERQISRYSSFFQSKII